MSKKRVHIHNTSAINAAQVSKKDDVFTIRGVCGAVDDIVMNGMLYPGNELAASAASLEGKPAPFGHPRNSAGQHISATSGPALLSSYGGAICTNARHEGGRTLVDMLVNEAQAQANPKGAILVKRLQALVDGARTVNEDGTPAFPEAGPIHVSTGLTCNAVIANGESQGKAYTRIATAINYDHLAILLDERGAGTPEQGVGMFLNSDGSESEVECAALALNEADATAAEKKLRDAIELHQKHMDGTEPTTGADGDKSQMKMMRMMKAAFAALTGKPYGSKDDGKGMAMNVAAATADRRFDGFSGWLRKLVSNGADLSFDQIADGLRAALPEGAWPWEVYPRYCIWRDREDRLWRQDYSVSSSDGSVSLQGEPTEVVRRVEYQPVANSQEKDEVKEHILAALNAAGVQVEGKTDAQLLDAYNAHVRQPVEAKLTAANEKVAGFEAQARAAETAERDALATKLAVNSSLTVEDLKLLPLDRLKAIEAAGKGAAPVIVGNAGQTQANKFDTLPE